MASTSYRYYGRKNRSRSHKQYRPCVSLSSQQSLEGLNSRTVDEDILLLLYGVFRKAGPPLSILKREYRRCHGDKAGDYLEVALEKWRNGDTRMSVQNMDRLADLVPRVITERERFNLLKKLYQTHRDKDKPTYRVNLTIGRNEHEAKVQIQRYKNMLVNMPKNYALPESVQNRMQWVCNDDSNLARKLIAAVEEELSLNVAQVATVEVDRLLSLLRSSQQVEGDHVIKFPYGTVIVSVRQKTFFEKIGDVFC